ncbi:MAG: DUF4198 domain-containing protein [Planctomycetaceae bacterium]|jgi:hypothetical protein|nr:DUF4198 domain-containing protein [Planctomycetaceae bacterium]
MQHLLKILIICTLATLLGCSNQLPPDLPKLFPCKVILQQEGKPLAGAKVFLSPENGSKWNAVGVTDTQGVAVPWTQGLYTGVAEGKYKVLISKQEIVNPPEVTSSASEQKEGVTKVYNLVEEIYGETDKTPLTIEVSSSQKEFTLDAGKSIYQLVPSRW